jgi:hypothetical protein
MFSEIFFLLILLAVFLDAEQLLELVKFLLSLYKDLKNFISKLKNSVNLDFKNIISDSSYLEVNYLNNKGITNNYEIARVVLYQPELNFDSQPELFDDLFL